MFMSLSIIFLVIFSGVCLTFMLLFFLRSERAIDRQLKAEDMLLENKKQLFSKKISLMREDEKVFFRLLEKIAGTEYYVFPQVHLTELIQVAHGVSDHENLYQILGVKSVDFAIFDKQTIAPRVAIELNGEYHFWKSQRSKDEMRKALFAQVGIGFVAIQKAASYNTQALQEQIAQYLSPISPQA
ncbi:MAG TPA: DUF2726 domain-containing protein [Methylomirabilota bacterium]|nr:DUF2726 domain-containing protein [Methylomirabilota bacterium]